MPGKTNVSPFPLSKINLFPFLFKAQVRAKVEHPFRVDQAAVRLHQGALPRTGQERRANGDAIGPVESVDGPPTFAVQRRRGASVMRKMAVASCSRQRKRE